MPNIKSAEKRMRQNARCRARNRSDRADLRTHLKKANTALGEGNIEGVEQVLPATLSALGKSAKKGLVHKNKAARLASRMSRKLNKLKAPSAS